MNNIMKYTIILFLLFFGFLKTQSQQIELDVFLNEAVVKNTLNNIKFINSIDYTPNGFLLLSSYNQFYMLGLENIPTVFNKTKTAIDAFTVTQNEALWVISGNDLCCIDSLGSLLTLYKLPISKAGIVSANSKNTAYIYDRIFQKGKVEYAIYQCSDKHYTRLSSTTAPILSAFEYKTSLLFSTGNKILCADSKTKTFFELFSLPQKENIISITGDTINHAIYFSTQDTVYRVQNGNPEYICMDFGGTLKYDGEGLLIFNPEKQLIIRLRNNILYPNIEAELSPLDLDIEESVEKDKLKWMTERRNLILEKQIPKAVRSANLVTDNTNPVFLSEYAYVLALAGIYENALINLDMAKSLNTFSERECFFAGQVFALMGYNKIAIELLKQSSAPKWIYSQYKDLYQEYKSTKKIVLLEDDVEILFKRANYLASTGAYFQSAALYEQILSEQPNEYISHIGYSITLEKIGLREMAAEEMERGISLMGNNPEYDEAKSAFNERLSELRQEKPSNPQASTNSSETITKFKPRTMLYAGGMFSSSITSFNSRFGLLFTPSLNASVDFGLSGASGNFSGNIGASMYYRYKFLAAGIGVSKQLKGSNGFSFKPSAGFSFLNKTGDASLDIFLDIYCPFKSGIGTTYGISIGYTTYIGKR